MAFALPAKAVCPVCTIAVGAGLGLSRWLGVDDLVSGIWVGGLLVSVSVWTYNWIKTKKFNFKYSLWIVSLLMYGITIIPLYYAGIIGHQYNKLFGIDKLLLGIILGTAAFLVASGIHFYLKKKNGDKSYFPYQKVAFPFVSLVILSVIAYYIIL